MNNQNLNKLNLNNGKNSYQILNKSHLIRPKKFKNNQNNNNSNNHKVNKNRYKRLLLNNKMNKVAKVNKHLLKMFNLLDRRVKVSQIKNLPTLLTELSLNKNLIRF